MSFDQRYMGRSVEALTELAHKVPAQLPHPFVAHGPPTCTGSRRLKLWKIAEHLNGRNWLRMTGA